MRTLANYLASLSTKTSPNGTEKLTALDGSALVNVANQSYQVVDTIAELPASIPVGIQILTRDSGTMWRGLLAGESSLPAGTPWPVRGYRIFSFWASTGATDFGGIHSNEIFGVVPELTNRFSNIRTFTIPESISRFEIFCTGGGPSVNSTPTTDNGYIQLAHINESTRLVTIGAARLNYIANEVSSSSDFGNFELREYPPAPTP
jgi:hypothetical protein